MDASFTNTLFDLMTAQTTEQAASLALAALVGCFERPNAACLLLWDGELGRYMVGDTWIGSAALPPSEVRRRALQAAHAIPSPIRRCMSSGSRTRASR